MTTWTSTIDGVVFHSVMQGKTLCGITLVYGWKGAQNPITCVKCLAIIGGKEK